MARLAELSGKTFALDSVVFIYALEAHGEYGNLALGLFEMLERGEARAVACDLVLAELIVKPLKMGRTEAAERYLRDLPRFPNLSFRSLSQGVVVAAARLRAASGLGLLDALHLSSAIDAGADVFLTNDARLKKPDLGIAVRLLRDFAA